MYIIFVYMVNLTYPFMVYLFDQQMVWDDKSIDNFWDGFFLGLPYHLWSK